MSGRSGDSGPGRTVPNPPGVSKRAAGCGRGRGRGQARQGEDRNGCRLQSACIPHAQSLTVNAWLDAASLLPRVVGDLPFRLPNTPHPGHPQSAHCSPCPAAHCSLTLAASLCGTGWTCHAPSAVDWMTVRPDLMCGHPTSHPPRPARSHRPLPPSPMLPPLHPSPPKPEQLTSLQPARLSTNVPGYRGTVVPRWARLSHAAAPSSPAQLTGDALAACAGLQRWPAPSSPVQRPAYLSRYPAMAITANPYRPTQPMPYPCPIRPAVAVHIIDDAASSRLPQWHVGTHLDRSAPHRTSPHLASPHVVDCNSPSQASYISRL